MRRNKVIALCGITAIVVAATAWSSRQEETKPQQPKPQAALEREYYTRMLPRLERTYELLRALYEDERIRATELDDVHLEFLFAQRRCGKLTKKEFDAKLKPLLARILNVRAEVRYGGRTKYLLKVRRLEWFAVFGQADLNTPVGISPWP